MPGIRRKTDSETLDGLRSSIEQKLGPAFRIRARQARAVAEEIKKIDTDYVLVCGDFNDTPISYAHRTIQGPLKELSYLILRDLEIGYLENTAILNLSVPEVPIGIMERYLYIFKALAIF